MIPTTPLPSLEALEKLQRLTRAYARFSRSATGLSGVVGGVMALGLCVVGASFDPPMGVRALLALAIPVWFLSKAWIRKRCYQRCGEAMESMDGKGLAIERISQAAAGGIATVMVALCGFLILSAPQKIEALPLLNKVALLGAPVVMLLLSRRINTPLEMLVAVNLLVQTVLMASGSDFGWKQQGAMFFWAALLLMIGTFEHARFRQVESELQRIRSTL